MAGMAAATPPGAQASSSSSDGLLLDARGKRRRRGWGEARARSAAGGRAAGGERRRRVDYGDERGWPRAGSIGDWMRRELSLVGETKDKAIEGPGVVWEHAVKEKVGK